MARVEIIGNGAREAALAWKVSQSPEIEIAYVVPGNAGTPNSVEGIDISDIEGHLKFVRDHRIDFTIVGPEKPLSLGIVDAFEKEGHKIFGPTQLAATIETSKIFKYKLNKNYGIPCAESWDFYEGEDDQAKAKVDELGAKEVVLKVDGLAGGHGVTLPKTPEEAYLEIDDIFAGKYPDSPRALLVQRKLKPKKGVIGNGELSVFTLSDGIYKVIIPIFSRDHKQLLDGDVGPNTGGMGGHRIDIDPKEIRKIDKTIITPTLNAMRAERIPFRGVLYSGLMLTDEGWMEIEQNVRWGDPEAELLMPLLRADAYRLMRACSEDNWLQNEYLGVYPGYTTGVVLATENYPQNPVLGDVIYGLDREYEGVNVFHYGTKKRADGQLETGSGRALIAVGKHPHSLRGSRELAYGAIGLNGINFRGMQYRTDLGLN